MFAKTISVEAGVFQRAAIFAFSLILIAIPATAQITIVDSALLQDQYHYYDQPINPSIYIIRPGEKLIVTFVNSNLPAVGLNVGPQGRIVHRNLGIYSLAGKTLEEVRKLLYEPLKQLYNIDEIDIGVSDPYRVSVSITGAVAEPGTYLGYTSALASEIIERAGGVLPGGSTRHIVMSGGTGDLPVDLDRVTFLGDNSANPCLYAGTRIFVPEKSDEVVTVVGEVNSPREIELLPGDDLPLLISLAGGATSLGDPQSAYLIGAGRQDVANATDVESGEIILVPLLKSRIRENQIAVFGAVNKPGRYTYTDGMILQDILDSAGGLSGRANVDRTTIFRRPEPDVWSKVPDIRFPVTGGPTRSRDLKATPLRPLDSVFIPTYVGFVKVSGRIRSPGYYPYIKGQEARMYIENAGGFAADADRSEIMVYNRLAEMSYPAPPDVTISDGDEIVVRKIEIPQ